LPDPIIPHKALISNAAESSHFSAAFARLHQSFSGDFGTAKSFGAGRHPMIKLDPRAHGAVWA
jgi:hypothetical protein